MSRICAALDAEVEGLQEPLPGGRGPPYLWLDATYVKVRDGGRVVNMEALVATGVDKDGQGVKRRTAVVGIFPTRASLIRLVGMVLAVQDDEWQDGCCYLRPESMVGIADGELIDPALGTMPCYTTSWDLTLGGTPGRVSKRS